MRHFIQIVSLLAISYFEFSCQYQTMNRNDLLKKNLMGRVKNLTEITYKAFEKFGEAEKGDFDGKIISKFNDNGNLISHMEYINDGRLVWLVDYKYDKNNKKIEESWHNEIHNFTMKYGYVYNEKNDVIEKNRYYLPDKLDWKYKYKNDSLGNIIEESWYDSSGAFARKIVYKNDVAGNKSEESFYDKEGSLFQHSENKYDSKRNIIESFETDFFETVGKFESKRVETKITYTYLFDKLGNWIKKIEFWSDKPYEITERQIEYY